MEGWWTVSYFVLWTVVITLCVMVVALARQIGTLHLRLGPRGALEVAEEGPPLGEAPPPLEARSLQGASITVGGPGREQLLFFVSPSCMICEEILPSVDELSRVSKLASLVIADSGEDEARAITRARLAAPVIASEIAAQHFRIPGTPYVVVIDELGVVRAKGTVNNLEQVEGLIDTARRRIAEERRLRAS